jgi:UDP-galactopyranose mutase
MIRLNDINNTVIDESKVAAYHEYEDDNSICIYLNERTYVDYESKELRDKDIELLDKFFNVKSILNNIKEIKNMIRLNDIDRTVINESKVVSYNEDDLYGIYIYLNESKYVDYESKEARDQDIELLGKLFNVKSINM